MKLSYKIIFTVFGICAILPTSLRSVRTFRSSISTCLKFLVNALIMIFYVFSKINLYLYQLRTLDFSFALVSTLFVLHTTIFMHRFCLWINLDELKKIAKIMSSFRIKENRVLCLYTWIAFGTLSCVLKFLVFVDTYEKGTCISKLFCVSKNNSVLYKVVVTSSAFNSAILMELPLHTFAAFFVIVSHDVKCVLKNFFNVMHSKYVENSHNLLLSFNSLRRTIDLLDDKLCFFVFCEILYSSCVLFFTVTIVLRQEIQGDSIILFHGICFMCYLVNILGIFIIVTISACSVSEAYAEAWRKLKTIIVNSNMNLALRQQNSFLCIEKEAEFTLWKIMPINRSFILVTMGAILTYVLLFDNLISIKTNL